jgi:hypothetical protein
MVKRKSVGVKAVELVVCCDYAIVLFCFLLCAVLVLPFAEIPHPNPNLHPFYHSTPHILRPPYDHTTIHCPESLYPGTCTYPIYMTSYALTITHTVYYMLHLHCAWLASSCLPCLSSWILIFYPRFKSNTPVGSYNGT